MESYIVQKVQDALKEILSDDSLVKRLKNARTHIHLISGEHYLSSCSEVLKQAILRFMDSDADKDAGVAATYLQAIIERTFEEDRCS